MFTTPGHAAAAETQTTKSLLAQYQGAGKPSITVAHDDPSGSRIRHETPPGHTGNRLMVNQRKAPDLDRQSQATGQSQTR